MSYFIVRTEKRAASSNFSRYVRGSVAGECSKKLPKKALGTLHIICISVYACTVPLIDGLGYLLLTVRLMISSSLSL